MNNKILYYILSCTWGIIMTFIGAIAALVLIIGGYKPEKNGGALLFKVGKNWGGISLGLTTIVCKNSSQSTINHEFGHTFQNCWWGILFPFVIGIPSAIRCAYRNYCFSHNISLTTEYDDIWFEGQATKLGNKYILSWQ